MDGQPSCLHCRATWTICLMRWSCLLGKKTTMLLFVPSRYCWWKFLEKFFWECPLGCHMLDTTDLALVSSEEPMQVVEWHSRGISCIGSTRLYAQQIPRNRSICVWISHAPWLFQETFALCVFFEHFFWCIIFFAFSFFCTFFSALSIFFALSQVPSHPPIAGHWQPFENFAIFRPAHPTVLCREPLFHQV